MSVAILRPTIAISDVVWANAVASVTLPSISSLKDVQTAYTASTLQAKLNAAMAQVVNAITASYKQFPDTGYLYISASLDSLEGYIMYQAITKVTTLLSMSKIPKTHGSTIAVDPPMMMIHYDGFYISKGTVPWSVSD
jgi:hypothetical protein